MMQFLLHQQRITLDNVDPNLTVLHWLRNDAQRCGSKEGCASGDCGACTVVVGSAENGRMRYRSANSCLLLVGQLAGKQLLTVEDLAQDGALHPVQQAIASGHASQCGFCTPGIVMSTFALHKQVSAPDRHTVCQHLGGNLCRCTGYRPIIDAALGATSSADSFSQQEAQTLARLGELQPPVMTPRFMMPDTLASLADCYQRYPDASLLAGGTDLNLRLTQGGQRHGQVIALQRVGELCRIERDGNRLIVGAMATLEACHQALASLYPAFGPLFERFASQQIRNHGTLGGNIANASPIGDGPPALLALDARLRLRCGDAVRELPLASFYTGYRQTVLQQGEFISHLLIGDVTLSQNLRLWKVSKRREDDISAVFAAIDLTEREGVVCRARIAFGGMAAIPARAYACEAALLGSPLDDQTLARACAALADDFSPMSDARASAGYRLLVAQNLLRRYVIQRRHPGAVEVSEYVC